MRQREGSSWLSQLLDPSKGRGAKRLEKQQDEVDDVTNVIEDNNAVHGLQESEEENGDALHPEVKMLLERVASDFKRIEEKASRRLNELAASDLKRIEEKASRLVNELAPPPQ